MTHQEAQQILEVPANATPEDIKRAYRRKAFETHPDRGGTAADFLAVQAAFEVLSSKFNGGFWEPGLDAALVERLDDIHRAFVCLEEDAVRLIQAVLSNFENDLTIMIGGYGSDRQMKSRAQADISALWAEAVNRIATHLEEQIQSIADEHERWLLEYLRPVAEAMRRENPPRWYERWATAWVAVGVGIIAASLGIASGHGWVTLLASPLAGVAIFPMRYRRKFDVDRLIQGVDLSDVRIQSRLSGLNVERNGSSTVGASASGAAIGASFGLFLGPIGAIAGGALGAVVGWLMGETLDERKEKLFVSVANKVNSILPEMLQELDHRLQQTESAMSLAMKENFLKNVRGMMALMNGR